MMIRYGMVIVKDLRLSTQKLGICLDHAFTRKDHFDNGGLLSLLFDVVLKPPLTLTHWLTSDGDYDPLQ